MPNHTVSDDRVVDLEARRRSRTEQAPAGISQDALASAFEIRFGETIKHDRHAGQWYRYEGHVWRSDRNHIVAQFMRELARQNSDGKKSVLTESFIGGAKRLAQYELSVARAEWDCNPMLLNTPECVVDLRTGITRPGEAADMMTKSAAVSPRKGAAPRWSKFIEESTLGDAELARYLQRACGYMLTGLTTEHALFFIFGAGGNGKSVFINVIRHILADYAVVADMDVFTEQAHAGHSTGVAMLAGARAVFASETEEGKAWAESRIKNLTGGDPVTARFMRQDFFTYTPQFKVCVIGNHAPVLKTVDDAMKRRFNIIPFTNKPAEPDRDLERTIIENEAPEVLAWMIEGCLAWQRDGLMRPERVKAATDEYLTGQDVLAEWMDECLRVERDNDYLFASTDELFRSWSAFATARGEQSGKAKGLASKIGMLGFQQKRTMIAGKQSRGFMGLQVIQKDSWHDRED